MNDAYQQVQQKLYQDQLKTITQKLHIGGTSVFVKVSLHNGKIVIAVYLAKDTPHQLCMLP